MDNDVVIFANFDTKNFNDPDSNFFNLDDDQNNVLNSVSDNIVLGVRGEPVPSKLSFSSNGIDGIGKVDDTFNCQLCGTEHLERWIVCWYGCSCSDDRKHKKCCSGARAE